MKGSRVKYGKLYIGSQLAPESDELPDQRELFCGRSIDKAHCTDTTVATLTAGHDKRALCRGRYVGS